MKTKSPLFFALAASLLAHVFLAFYLQYSQVLDFITLSKTQSDTQNLVVLDAAHVPLPAILVKKTHNKTSPKQESKHSQEEKKIPNETQDKPVEPQKPDTPAPDTSNESEVLPHEELARKKETLASAELPLKDKAAQFSVANKVQLSYEGAWGGTPVQGILSFQLNKADYTASLQLTASTIFKTFELKQTAIGVLNIHGFEVFSAQDKAINGRTTAIAVEPSNQRVIISSKEGFLPYSAGGKDLLSLILQLGILSQAQPEWKTKGTQQDFTVYRPSGIKRWRYQSQGLESTQVGANKVETIYIKRVPQSNEPDFEYIHHLWLDPARHGLPLRIKLEDPKSGRTIDLVLNQWEES